MARSRQKPEVRERQRLAAKAWKRANPERVRELNSRPRPERDKAKRRARRMVQSALDRGDLRRGPCERAGTGCEGRIQAHHDDYDRPLDVRWLCSLHHGAEHRLDVAA